MSKAERSRNLSVLVVLVGILLFFGGFFFNYWQTSIQRDDAQSYGASQAQQKKDNATQVFALCESGKVEMDAQGIATCEKAEQVAQQPITIEGPSGPIGPRGLPGVDGKDSTVPGPAGKAGKDGASGANGADSTTPGPQGVAGKDGASIVGPPGPAGGAGKDGAPGIDGAPGTPGVNGVDGTSPTSFSFAGPTGIMYSCTPNPPGSSTFVCTRTVAP
ncbi:hypothetical protein [Arthrobacter cryoconiti]|uniref:Collagen triple helix repeat-containing protein n=1 Tax=Arthrobacter cryoconiti TaxID=748907 RepID=A0ABV8QWK0_9MICC|nr:hypothetical protein [Arthrobacter cryoconiti]MCC9068786.1 hypothetical protein [Arthrobacter cryoconiti]